MRAFILAFSVIGGLTAAVFGPVLAVLFAGLSLWGRDVEQPAVWPVVGIALGLAVLGTGLGLPLAWVGYGAMRGATSALIRPWKWWGWLAALFGVLVIGQVLAFSGPADLARPVFQLAAAVLPAIVCLSLVFNAAGPATHRVTRRHAIGGLAWGGLASAGLAALVELLVVLAAALCLALGLLLFAPVQAERLWTLMLELAATGRPPDLFLMRDLTATPLFAVGVLGLLGVVGPLIEELLKAAAVPLLIEAGNRPDRLSGFLIGATAGAGFAIAEGVLNGSVALNMAEMWAGLMLLRGAAAAMHCLAAGLAGLGWLLALREQRRLVGLSVGLLAFGVHSAWNTAVALIGLLSLRGSALADPAALARLGLTGLLVLLLMALALLVIVGLVLLPRYLARA